MRNLFFGFALLGLFASCSADSYKISGKFEDLSSGTVYLRKIEAQGLSEVDTAEVSSGAFVFEGKAEHPELYLIFAEDVQEPIVFFLENSSIKITANTEKMDEAVIKGSKLTDLFKQFNDNFPHIEKEEQMREEFMTAQSQQDQATMQSIMADMETIMEDRQTYYKDFVKSNSNNAVGAFLALNMAQSLEYEEIEELLTNLEAALGEHPYVISLQEMMEPLKAQKEAEAALSIGNAAPDFTLTDLEGNEVSLSDFRGKYVFIDFWAAWCRPCREENPLLVEVYKQFAGEDFEIISVSLDQTEEAWRQAVQEDKLTWTQLHDPANTAATSYMVQSIPNTWLLDKDGKIMHKQIRSAELTEVLKGLQN